MPHIVGSIGICLVAVLHIWFCLLEMFLWNKPLGQKIFKLDKEFATRSAALAANQGLYNLFLAAGLIWSLLPIAPIPGVSITYFFLGCVILAGTYGAATVSKRIFYIQASPAIIVMAILCLNQS